MFYNRNIINYIDIFPCYGDAAMKGQQKITYQFITFCILILFVTSSINTVFFVQAQEQTKESIESTFPDRTYVKRLLRFADMPGFSVGIINQDGTVDYYNFGETTRRSGNTPTKDTVYFAASITKTVTGVAIMQLWEQGKIDLDADVKEYLPFELRHPDYPDTPITTRMLLSHTSGLTNILWRSFLYFSFFHYPLEWYEYFLTPGNPFYREDNWQEYGPEEGIYYTSLGYDLLGLIVERVSGMEFEDYCQQHIFEPLNMHNTSLRLSDYNMDQFATFYLYLFGIYLPIPYYEVHNDGSAGMSSTVEDLIHYLKMHLQNGSYENTQILKPETIELMHTVQYPDLPTYDIYRDNRNYGLGWIVWPDENQTYNTGMEGHLGNTLGCLSSMTVLNGTGVVFFGNEWTRLSYKQTAVMFALRSYFHTKIKPSFLSILS